MIKAKDEQEDVSSLSRACELSSAYLNEPVYLLIYYVSKLWRALG